MPPLNVVKKGTSGESLFLTELNNNSDKILITSSSEGLALKKSVHSNGFNLHG